MLKTENLNLGVFYFTGVLTNTLKASKSYNYDFFSLFQFILS